MFRTEINQTLLTHLCDQIAVFVNSVFRLQPPFFFWQRRQNKAAAHFTGCRMKPSAGIISHTMFSDLKERAGDCALPPASCSSAAWNRILLPFVLGQRVSPTLS